MRLSVRKDDSGYNPEALDNCRSFVDGVDVTARCYTADEEEGKAWCFKLNELGQKFIDPETNEPAVEVLSGEVIIVLRETNGYDPHSCN